MKCHDCRRAALPHFSRCRSCLNALYARMGFGRRGL
jgi:hypothetical protein